MIKRATPNNISPDFFHTGAPIRRDHMRVGIESHNFAIGNVTENVWNYYGAALTDVPNQPPERLTFPASSGTIFTSVLWVPLHAQRLTARLEVSGTGSGTVQVRLDGVPIANLTATGPGGFAEANVDLDALFSGALGWMTLLCTAQGNTAAWIQNLYLRTRTIAAVNIPDPPTGE